jgi:site-specific DNA-cytosine methylase
MPEFRVLVKIKAKNKAEAYQYIFKELCNLNDNFEVSILKTSSVGKPKPRKRWKVIQLPQGYVSSNLSRGYTKTQALAKARHLKKIYKNSTHQLVEM